VIGTVKVGLRPYAVALARGKAFVTNQYGNSVTVFDTSTLEVLKTIDVGDYPEGIAPSRDGKHVFVASWFANTLGMIDTETLKVVKDVKVGDGPRAFGQFIR
jgi:YVTN family beta-propeller protein